MVPVASASKNFPCHSFKKPVDLSLYLVTDRVSTRNERDFIARVNQAAQGGVTCVQLRDRNEDLQASLRSAYSLKKILDKQNVGLIINNRVDVAQAIGAGLHIGQRDFPYQEARRLLGNKAVIGLTVDCIQDVIEAEKFDVDYLGVHVFPSKQTKPQASNILGLHALHIIRSISRHRLVAIGGIKVSNLESVYRAMDMRRKENGIAMVGEIWRSEDPCAKAKEIRAIFDCLKRGD